MSKKINKIRRLKETKKDNIILTDKLNTFKHEKLEELNDFPGLDERVKIPTNLSTYCRAHEKKISSLFFNKACNNFITTGMDNEVKLWNAIKGNLNKVNYQIVSCILLPGSQLGLHLHAMTILSNFYSLALLISKLSFGR